MDADFVEKSLPTYKNSSSIVSNQSDLMSDSIWADEARSEYVSKSIHNLIVNKLYTELGSENNNSKLSDTTRPFPCGAQSPNDIDPKPKPQCSVQIDDVPPNGVTIKDSPNGFFVENRGYDLMVPAKLNRERAHQEKNGQDEFEGSQSTNARVLKSIDLLNFAKQIASGMVCHASIIFERLKY